MRSGGTGRSYQGVLLTTGVAGEVPIRYAMIGLVHRECSRSPGSQVRDCAFAFFTLEHQVPARLSTGAGPGNWH
jgi:hypothetical protein